MSTPWTMFSQCPLPALPPLRGTGGGVGAGCSITRMYCSWIFNGPFALRSCPLWNIKQFVIEVGGLLLVRLPCLGPPPSLHCPHPQFRLIPPFRSPLAHGEGQISLLTHQSRPPSVLASPYLPLNDRRRAPQMGHPHAQLCLCVIIKRVSPGGGGDTKASRVWS